jgi:hypothetical protein
LGARPSAHHPRAGVRDAGELEEALQASVGAVAPPHRQKGHVDPGLAQGHVDIPVHEHGERLVPQLAEGGHDGFARTPRSITLDGEAAEENANLAA